MKMKFHRFGVCKNPEMNEVIHRLGGFWICLQRYGIWKNGGRYVGALDIPIREALENEVMRLFEPGCCDEVTGYIMDNFQDVL